MKPENTANSESPPARFALSDNLVTRLRLAASFLTILPVSPSRTVRDADAASSFALFPLVGLLIGIFLVIEDRSLAFFFGLPITGLLLVLSLAIITGGLHLDGLADTADALGAGSDRSRVLEILRDSRLGSFGAIALFMVLALKWAAIVHLSGYRRFVALLLAPCIGRWAMIAVSFRLDYLRTSGAGSTLLRENGSHNLALASSIAIAATLAVLSTRAVAGAIAVVLLVAALRTFYNRWIGGVTGDLVGAAGEIAESLILIVMAAR